MGVLDIYINPSEEKWDSLCTRKASREKSVTRTVKKIMSRVRREGDAALKALSQEIDGIEMESLQVSENEFLEAEAAVSDKVKAAVAEAAENIRAFHEAQRSGVVCLETAPGVKCYQKAVPISKVGLYIPGGTAPLFSTVLMLAIPAKVAGCIQTTLCTPVSRQTGKVSPEVLFAARYCGVDKVFKAGGAQAIAALAYGTESVPKVDKIVGPGNAFVAEAKKQVFGQVSIDMIAGPSEILIVSDGGTEPKVAAADLLSQAEHDKLASAVLVTDSMELAMGVQAELEKQIPLLERAEIARASIDNNGKIIVADSLDAAIEIANEIAPEHLELCVDAPFDYLDKIRHAGSIFMGRNCPEALGDYFAGPNHTLPTSGTAKFSSPLSVDDFIKKTQYTYYTRDALKRVAKDVYTFACAEGLTAHAKSAVVRTEDEQE